MRADTYKYTKVLYPIQDKVLPLFKDSPFYLTGGTALSRGYYNHRYSDDLDFFVNDRSDFQRIVERIIVKVKSIYTDIVVNYKDDNFCRFMVADHELKVELINDVPSHIGNLVNHPTLGMIDSKENILANKLTALIGREEPKDIADLYFLLKDGLNLKQALLDADSKAAGIAPLIVSKVLTEFDYSRLAKEINLVNPVSSEEIKEFFNGVTRDIMYGKEQHHSRGRHR